MYNSHIPNFVSDTTFVPVRIHKYTCVQNVQPVTNTSAIMPRTTNQ